VLHGWPAGGVQVLATEHDRPRADANGQQAAIEGLSDVLCEVGVTDTALRAGKGQLVQTENEN
jgi:hypothetical protein